MSRESVHTEDAHVPAAVALGLQADGGKRVGEVLEERVLQPHLHAQQPVQELAHAAVV